MMVDIKEGDLVEVINVSSSQLSSIRSQRCNFNILPSEIINNQYYVSRIIDDFGSKPLAELKGWNHGGHFNGWFQFTQLRKLNDT